MCIFGRSRQRETVTSYMSDLHSNADLRAQIPLALSVGDKATFENYWVGHNSELVAALLASVRTGDPQIVYFYGSPGAGKSHLLFAAMRLAKEEIINSSYLSLSDDNMHEGLLEVVDVANLVCVDNFQCWAGDESRERALFTLFEQVRHHGGQLLIAAEQSPERCGFQLPDLISRLSSGLVYALRELTDEQRFEAVKLRASIRGLSISDDTVRYLLSRSSRDNSELFSVLDQLDRASLIEKRRITIPFLQKLINS